MFHIILAQIIKRTPHRRITRILENEETHYSTIEFCYLNSKKNKYFDIRKVH